MLDHAELTTGSGAVQVGSVDGAAVSKNSNDDTWIGEVTGDLRVNAANGKISVDQANATVAAKTAKGDVRLGEVAGGAVIAQTGFGKLDVGVRDGVAAWLDLNARNGNVLNRLDVAERPEPGRGHGRSACPQRLRGHHRPPLVCERHREGRGMTGAPAIRAEGLRQTFGDVVALDGLDLEVQAGIVFGLLGPSGAGGTSSRFSCAPAQRT